MSEEQLRVLLVDDEASVRGPLAKFLREKYSYAVDTAADGERAWSMVTQSESPYQVALIDDLMTPSTEEEARPFGVELMKRIKSEAPQTEVIIFTGWGMERAREALQAGAFRYMAKPLNYEELALNVRHAAELQRLKGAAREKQILEQLMKTSAALLGSQNQQEAINRILQGIQAIGFDRARLYLLADNGKLLVGKAQVGMDERFIGVKWPVADDCYMQTIIADRSPHVFKREAGKPLHSEEFLDKDGVDEWACVPLLLRGAVIGKVSADNKHSRRPIVAQELMPITLFASQAAAVIELSKQKDDLERLIASSPNGIIAVDAKGTVIQFNKQAEEILGYKANEVLGAQVEYLYFDPKEPRRIGGKLHSSANGRVTSYETTVKAKDGQAIPILHSSTWLYDSSGKRSGSVGYFEDLRPIRETKQRIELLLRANNVVAQAENMDDGLKSLAEMIVALLNTTFCRIFLLDESNKFLVAKAVAANPGFSEKLDWSSGLGERTDIAEWPGLSDTLSKSDPVVLRIGGKRGQSVLREWSRRLKLNREIQSLLVIPLRTKNKVVGLLDVGELRAWDEAPFTQEKKELAAAIANQIVVLVDRLRLHEITERRSQLLRSSYEASNTLVSSKNPQQTLQDVVEQARRAADASWVRLILIDETGRKRNPVDVLAIAGTNKQLDVASIVRPNGLSMKVLRTGKAEVIEDANDHRDRISDFMIREGSAAALCLPLSLQGKRIGVMWIHYDKPRRFSEAEIEALQLYVNHAAIAYDAAQRVEELKQLSQAAQAISKVSALNQTLRTIVEEAVKMFQADFSTIWSYDSGGRQFLPEELEAVGYSEEELRVFKEREPQPGGWTFTALNEGWVSAHDVSSSEYEFLTGSKREILRQHGIASFQAVALRVGHEPMGVLYVSYKQQRTFGEEDRRSLESFAAHAALSLRNAKLLDQVSKAKTAAMAVARMTALGDHNATLNSIANGTLVAMRCDAVVLFVYDQATNRLDHPPTMVGVRYKDRAMRYGEVLPDSFVYKILEFDEPYIVEKIATDNLFKDSRFALDEGIKSCVAITLKAAGQKVGVMFVNYHTPRRFTHEEITDIKLFADQAAIAIRNAQLFEDAKQLPGQKALVRLSEKLLGTVKQEEMLGRAVAVAADVLGADLAGAILPDKNGNLILKAKAGCWRGVIVGQTRFEGGKGSHTGYTILEKEPVIVDNYAEEKRFSVARIVFENGIQSSMSVPMFSGNEVVGAMVVYSRELRRFAEAEKTLLSLIANQTAIALKSAEQYEAIERKRAYLNALYEASKAITGSFALEQKQVLNCIVQQAVECVIGSQAPAIGFGVVHLYNEATDELICESVHALQELPHLSNKVGQIRSLNEGPIGISGRTVKTRQAQLVRNVSTDGDYVEFDPRVKSQLTAPLLYQDKVIGVISLESEQTEAFDEDAQNTLQALAELAVIAIRNAQQYRELRETKGLVGSRTALAWTGMISSAWRHTIGNHAVTIRERVQLLRRELSGGGGSGDVAEHLDTIERLANRILERPITPPLSIEEGVQSVSINDLIRDRTRQLWNNEPYRLVSLNLDLKLENSATTRASAEWLRRCLDVLIDNAVEATVVIPERKIAVASQQVDGRAEIFVTDNGRGIPEERLAQLFREPIKKSRGAKGMGIGLLFAQTIVQTYGGDIRCESSGPAGATMVISLPLES
jgi:PAS domain S-box-containing protein